MSARSHDVLNAWKMVASRRQLQGRVPLSALPRLAGLLFDSQGEVTFSLEFDRDALGAAYVELQAETLLPLQCQRSLARFELPVNLHQRLGLIREEAEEAGLPPGYEPRLVPDNGELRALDLVEDELILAIPVVPMAPDGALESPGWSPPAPAEEPPAPHPFAILATLKSKS